MMVIQRESCNSMGKLFGGGGGVIRIQGVLAEGERLNISSIFNDTRNEPEVILNMKEVITDII